MSVWSAEMASAIEASPLEGVVSHGMGIVMLELSGDIFDLKGTLKTLPAHHVNFVRNFSADLSSSEYRLEFTAAKHRNWRLYAAMAVASLSGIGALVGPTIVGYIVAHWPLWSSDS